MLKAPRIRIFQFACLALLVAVRTGHAEDVPASTLADSSTPKELSPLRKLMDESLAWNELSSGHPTAKPMTPQVVMRWANNSRGSEDGMTVLYLSEGRPEAACCIFPWEKSLVHDFSSLSRATFTARQQGIVVWQPNKPGVQFQRVPDAEKPADTPVARMRQMRELVKSFSSTMLGWKSDKTDRESLRLLPRPLYRYESTRADMVDGAVFAFVQGTDPESLLLLEAFKAQDKIEWQYAFVRRTSGELEGRFKGEVVWHADPYPVSTDVRSTYRNLSRPIPSSVLESISKKE